MSDRSADTIAAIATAPGRGAVGILRLSGPRAFGIAEKIGGPLPVPRTVALRVFLDAQGARCDSGLVICFDAPRSYTGEAVVEMQGHGGPAVLELLLGAACSHGARRARPGEFSERAFLNGRLDLTQAEAVADLIDASSRAAVLAAHRALDGEFSQRVQAIAGRLLDLRVFVEGALDFSDEDIDWLSDTQLAQGMMETDLEVARLLAQAVQGRRLREGMVVAIAGRPNVGKSTLLNRLARADVAIVSEIPGTTRDVLREQLILDGLPLTVIDTAGLRETRDPVEAEGIRRAWQTFERAELALFVTEDAVGLTDVDRTLLARLPSTARQILVFNKCDLSGLAPDAFEVEGRKALRVCAATGEGLDALRTAIRATAGLDEQIEGVFSARARHLDALRLTQQHLRAARERLGSSVAELAAEELRLAHDALGTITGRTTTEDLLGAVFSRFCIGK